MNYEFKSEMASDMNGLIEIKVATHHCESTYLDRAKSFDSFCAEHYPDADLVTQSIVLEWIKDALDSHTRNVAYTRVAFIRALAEYQKAVNPAVTVQESVLQAHWLPRTERNIR